MPSVPSDTFLPNLLQSVLPNVIFLVFLYSFKLHVVRLSVPPFQLQHISFIPYLYIRSTPISYPPHLSTSFPLHIEPTFPHCLHFLPIPLNLSPSPLSSYSPVPLITISFIFYLSPCLLPLSHLTRLFPHNHLLHSLPISPPPFNLPPSPLSSYPPVPS